MVAPQDQINNLVKIGINHASIYWELRLFAYDKFIIFIFTNLTVITDNEHSVLLDTTLPTGQFNVTRVPDPIHEKQQVTTGPALQLGKDTDLYRRSVVLAARRIIDS